MGNNRKSDFIDKWVADKELVALRMGLAEKVLQSEKPGSWKNFSEKKELLKAALDDPFFSESRLAAGKILLRRETSPQNVAAALDSQLSSYLHWIGAKKLMERGIGPKEIALTLGLPKSIITHWKWDRLPNELVNPLQSSIKVKKPLNLPFDENMAFLAAAYSAFHISKSPEATALVACETDPELFSGVKAALEGLGIEYSLSKGKNRIDVYSTELIDALDKFTKRRQGVPIEHLDTEGKIRAYVRGLALSTGSFYQNPKITKFAIDVNPDLKRALLLFPKLGLFPNFVQIRNGGKKRNLLQILFTPAEFDELLGQNILGKRHIAEIKKGIEVLETRSFRKHPSIKQVELGLGLTKSMQLGNREASRLLGIPFESVKHWGSHGMPRAVARLMKHVELARSYGHPLDHIYNSYPLSFGMGVAVSKQERGKVEKLREG